MDRDGVLGRDLETVVRNPTQTVGVKRVVEQTVMSKRNPSADSSEVRRQREWANAWSFCRNCDRGALAALGVVVAMSVELRRWVAECDEEKRGAEWADDLTMAG